MNTFEEAVAAELFGLMRAGAPVRAVRITVRELLVTRMERGPLGAQEVGEAVEAAVRAAGRLVRERNASDELFEAVCRAALEAVRGHGGETSRWLAQATSAASAVIDDLARERGEDPTWRWVARRLAGW